MHGDDWEKAFTAVIVHNLAELRERDGLTIDQFAKRCDEVVGEPGRFKPNTMQGLFAGKRKNIAATELVVFARALGVPLLALLMPLHDKQLPDVTGHDLAPVDVWLLATGIGNGPGDWAWSTIEASAELARALQELRSGLAAFRLLDDERRGSAHVTTTPAAIAREVRDSLRVCQALLSNQPWLAGGRDPVIEWARRANPDRVSPESLGEIARELIREEHDDATAPNSDQ